MLDQKTLEYIRRMTEIAAIKPTLAERMRFAQQCVPKMSSNRCSISPLLLTVPIFSISKSTSSIDVTWHRKGFGHIHYVGPTLSQSHATLLFALLRRCASLDATSRIIVSRSALLRDMGWSENTRNQERLCSMLNDLKSALLEIGTEDWQPGFLRDSVRLLAYWESRDDGRLELVLGWSILKIFVGPQTYLNLKKRATMREGIGTFLFGYVSANSCHVPFAYSELHRACGSRTKDLSEFSKSVRATLKKMLELGLIKGYVQLRGKVKVIK